MLIVCHFGKEGAVPSASLYRKNCIARVLQTVTDLTPYRASFERIQTNFNQIKSIRSEKLQSLVIRKAIVCLKLQN